MDVGSAGVCRDGWVCGSFAGYLGLALIFVGVCALRERFNFCFPMVFLVVLAKYWFWRGAGHWVIILWSSDTFLTFPKSFGDSFGNSCIPCL